jgi:superfamily II DNA or RNA helicase
MIKALRTNKEIVIESIDSPSDETKMREALTVTVPNYFFTSAFRRGAWDGKFSFYNAYTRSFPSGLFCRIPPEIQERFIIADQRVRPVFIAGNPQLQGIEMRDYQLEMVRQAIERGNAIISAPCGSGKTEMAAAIIKSIPVQTVWLTHRGSLLIQTKERLEKRLGEEVGILMADKTDLKRITVAMVQTLSNRMKDDDPEVKKFFHRWFRKTTQMLILDEAHHASSPTWYQLAKSCDAYFRFGLSATPLFGDALGNFKLIATTGEELKVIDNKELVERGVSAKPVIYRLDNFSLKFINSNRYPLSYMLGIEQNVERNKIIEALTRRHIERKDPILILVTKINHGKLLKALLKDVEGVELLTGATSYEYRDQVLKKLDTGEVKAIIATQIFDEGVDAPNVRVLIFACAGRSWRELLQRLGRGMRRKSEGENKIIVYDFADKGDAFLEEHSTHRLKLFKKEGFDVIPLGLDILNMEMPDVGTERADKDGEEVGEGQVRP